MKVFFDNRYVGSAHSFDTTKKAELVANAIETMPGVTLASPKAATQRELAMIHDPRYVRAVLTGKGKGKSSAGFPWDPGYATAVSTSTGGAVEAALTALREGVSGSLSSGLHHADSDSGAGFCTFNGLALAAKIALGDRPKGEKRRRWVRPRCKKVLILDLDAHCGGGTYDIIKDDRRIWQIDISVSGFDSYTGKHPERHHLHLVRDADDYLPLLELELERAAEEGFDLVLYNAGMDPHEDCGVGGLNGITSDIIRLRERMVFDWARARGIPVAFVLAGGYTGYDLWEEKLTALHQMTVAAATQGRMPDMEEIEANAPERPKFTWTRYDGDDDEGEFSTEGFQTRFWDGINDEAARELATDLGLNAEPWDDYAAEDEFVEEPELPEYKSIHELPQEFFEIDNDELRAQYPQFFE
jgi:acetoin utilization deacetylase AcuC-like enzyme